MPKSTIWSSSSTKSVSKSTTNITRTRLSGRPRSWKSQRRERPSKILASRLSIISFISIWDHMRITIRTSAVSCKKKSTSTLTISSASAWPKTSRQATPSPSTIRFHHSRTTSKARSKSQSTRSTSGRRMRSISLLRLRVRPWSSWELARMWHQSPIPRSHEVLSQWLRICTHDM